MEWYYNIILIITERKKFGIKGIIKNADKIYKNELILWLKTFLDQWFLIQLILLLKYGSWQNKTIGPN